jgi:sulfoxide reductase heme-binding subunit YedZ
MTTRFQSRLINHTIIVVASAVLLLVGIALIDSPDRKYQWSMATGYVSIILLALSLLIGPFNVYTRRLNPVSSDLRRDIGIWCGVVGILHVAIGIQVHMGNIWLYFFKKIDGPDAFRLRDDIFGAANYVGLAATLVLLTLVLLSNDISLRWLRSDRWKRIQRWNYFLFAAVLVHGILYQIIENRIFPIIIVFAVVMLIAIIGQLVGFTIKKRERK